MSQRGLSRACLPLLAIALLAACSGTPTRPAAVPADAVHRGAGGIFPGWWQHCSTKGDGEVTCSIWNINGLLLQSGRFVAIDGRPVAPGELENILDGRGGEQEQINLEGGRVLAPLPRFWQIKAFNEGWSVPPPQMLYVGVRTPSLETINASRVAIVDERGTELAVGYTEVGLRARLSLPLEPLTDELYVTAEHDGYASIGNRWKLTRLRVGVVGVTLTPLTSVTAVAEGSRAGKVTVVVKDLETDRRLAGVRVFMLGDGTGELASAYTDREGVARLDMPATAPRVIMTEQDRRLGPYYMGLVRWRAGQSAYEIPLATSCEPECPWQ